MYKIFINDKPFIICNTIVEPKRFENLEHIPINQPIAIMDLVRKTESRNCKGIILLCNDPATIYTELKSHFTSIEAGGGIVINKQNEILLIKRLGKWDLPKGKIDPGEKMEECAIREVEEECGIDKLKIKIFLGNSFHSYKLQGHRFLKIIHWYVMETEFEDDLTPQTEESITEVCWKDLSEQGITKLDTYNSIREILFEVKELFP